MTQADRTVTQQSMSATIGRNRENNVSNLLVIMQANPHSHIDQLHVNPCQAKF